MTDRGYSSKQASELRQPPAGPAPGAEPGLAAARLAEAEALLRDPEMYTVGPHLRSRIDAFLAGGDSDA